VSAELATHLPNEGFDFRQSAAIGSRDQHLLVPIKIASFIPTTVWDIVSEYPFLLTLAWICVGIWVWMPLAVVIAGVSGIGIILGAGFAVVIAVAGDKATRYRLS